MTFQREDRYIVIKYTDIAKFSSRAITADFYSACRKLHDTMLRNGAPARMFVTVEQDWPEYQLVWAMIEHRMAGKTVPDFNLWRRADELQQRLNEADQRVDDAKSVLRTIYNHGQIGHYGMTKIEDFFGQLSKDSPEVGLPKPGEHPLCLLCLDEKTVPGKNPGDFVRDCPDCCGEEG